MRKSGYPVGFHACQHDFLRDIVFDNRMTVLPAIQKVFQAL